MCLWQYTSLVESVYIWYGDHEGLSKITALAVQMMVLPHGLKIDRDHQIKDHLGHYCPKIFETAKKK